MERHLKQHGFILLLFLHSLTMPCLCQGTDDGSMLHGVTPHRTAPHPAALMPNADTQFVL